MRGGGARAALALGLLPFLFGFDLLQSKNRDVEQGNAAMKAGKAEDALAAYDKAAKSGVGADPSLHFDRGTALYALSRFDEAGQEFLRATEAKDPAVKASAFYNLGNAFAKSNKYKEAIEAYKRSLALEPRDNKTKANLELAQRQQKEEEKKQQNKDDKNKKDDQKKDDKKNKDDKKDDQKKDDQKQDDKKNDEQKKDQNKDQNKDPNKGQKPEPQQQPQPQPADDKKPEQKPADEQEIGAVLDSLEKSPRDLEKERARLRAVRRRPPAKDW